MIKVTWDSQIEINVEGVVLSTSAVGGAPDGGVISRPLGRSIGIAPRSPRLGWTRTGTSSWATRPPRTRHCLTTLKSGHRFTLPWVNKTSRKYEKLLKKVRSMSTSGRAPVDRHHFSSVSTLGVGIWKLPRCCWRPGLAEVWARWHDKQPIQCCVHCCNSIRSVPATTAQNHPHNNHCCWHQLWHCKCNKENSKWHQMGIVTGSDLVVRLNKYGEMCNKM